MPDPQPTAAAGSQQPVQQPAAQPAPPSGMMRGDAKDDGGFDAARARAKQKAKKEDEDFSKKLDLQKQADARADQIIEGVDLDALAKEVDEDFSMASKFRNLRQMTPEATKKLAEIRNRVKERKAAMKPAEGTQPVAGSAPAAGAQPAAGAAPQGSAAPAAGAASAAAPAAGAQPPAGGAPATGTPDPAKPAATDDFTKKLDDLRKEFDTKLTAQQKKQQELEAENAKLKADKQKFEEEKKKAAEQQRVDNFNKAAKAAGIPDDLSGFAYTKAQDIVNKAGAKLTYQQIFDKLKEQHPSIFNTKEVKPAATETKEEPKFQVRPGTGSPTGGKGSTPPAVPKQERGADSWDESRRKLKERVKG